MVDHDTLAHPRAGVNIDPENLGDAHLQEPGHGPAPGQPQPVCHPIGHKSLKPLEEQDRLDQPVTGRIAVQHRHQIGARSAANARIVGHGGAGDLAQQLLGHFGRGKLQRHPISQRIVERGVVQQAGMDQPAEQRLVLHRLGGLAPDPLPQRIDHRHLAYCPGHDVSFMRNLPPAA